MGEDSVSLWEFTHDPRGLQVLEDWLTEEGRIEALAVRGLMADNRAYEDAVGNGDGDGYGYGYGDGDGDGYGNGDDGDDGYTYVDNEGNGYGYSSGGGDGDGDGMGN